MALPLREQVRRRFLHLVSLFSHHRVADHALSYRYAAGANAAAVPCVRLVAAPAGCSFTAFSLFLAPPHCLMLPRAAIDQYLPAQHQQASRPHRLPLLSLPSPLQVAHLAAPPSVPSINSQTY